MSFLSILIIAIGLAMDCFSISIAKGVVATHDNNRHLPSVLFMAFCFGLFQGMMPLITFFAGSVFAETIDKYDHWIALVLLSVIGLNMIRESFSNDEEQHTDNNFSITNILLLSVATSIDALATGIIFVPTPQIIVQAVIIIALTSFVFSLVGFYIGKKAGRHLKINVELIGGIILIAIGVKIFLEHIL